MIGGKITLANGQTKSASIDLMGGRLLGFILLDTWTAATVSLESSFDGGTTWYPVYLQDGTLLSFTVAADHLIILDNSRFLAFGGLVKLVSSVAQGADRTIIPIIG